MKTSQSTVYHDVDEKRTREGRREGGREGGRGHLDITVSTGTASTVPLQRQHTATGRAASPEHSWLT